MPKSPAVRAVGSVAFRDRPCCEICGGDPESLFDCAFGSDPVKTFLEEYYKGRIDPSGLGNARFSIRRCRGCGFIWQGEVLSEPGLELLYEFWIDPEESLKKSLALPLYNRLQLAHQIALAVSLLRRKPRETRALDFGMGWGGWCDMARAFGVAATGAELSARRIAHGRARGLEVETNLFESGRSFDLINTEQVFEHVTDPVSTLKLLTARLAPGGLLHMSVPNASRFLRAFARAEWQPGKDAMHPLEHVNGFTHRSLIHFGASAGLRPVGTGRFLVAHARAVAWHGALNLRTAAESLYGQFAGVAIWFEHDKRR